jgi:DNA-binding transcriptional LysR family regulator
LGAGIAAVLAYQVEEAVRARRLEVLLSEFELPPVPIHLLHASARLPSAAVRAFIDTVVSAGGWPGTARPL